MKRKIFLIVALLLALPVMLLTGCDLTKNYISVESIAINGPSVVDINQEVLYTATITPNNATNKAITWSIVEGGTSSATILQSGLFKATTTGTVTIKATSGIKSETKAITVNDNEIGTYHQKLTLDYDFLFGHYDSAE